MNVTHIVSAHRETQEEYDLHPDERIEGIIYLLLSLQDDLEQSILSAVSDADTFIDNALKQTQYGRVLVHCAAGVSRSTSILIYHLMETYDVDYDTAFEWIYSVRNVVRPNDNFKRQLQGLDRILRLNREHNKEL